MTHSIKLLPTLTLAAVLSAATILAGTANSNSTDGSTKLLTANFVSRNVVQVEAGDFHFKPGQVAPIRHLPLVM